MKFGRAALVPGVIFTISDDSSAKSRLLLEA